MQPKCWCHWSACVFCAMILAYPPRAAEPIPPAVISEFLATNQYGMQDEDGAPSAWIEIYNSGRAVLNLEGWSLTDTRTNLTKWRFPHVSLLPDKYLVVFASGKGRGLDLVHLHTNFQLDPRGGYLGLVDRSTNVISEFAHYPEQAPDISYGRVPGDPATTGSFFHPTPGKPNASHGLGFAPEVLFFPSGGALSGATGVELSCGSVEASIHYTLDGRLPNASSPIYRKPLIVTNTVQVRARAYQPGLLPGPPRSETYLALDSRLRAFTSNLPILVLDMLDGPSWPDSLAHLSVFEPVHGRTSLTNSPAWAARVGYHVRGSSTLDMPQSSFALHLLNEFNQEQPHSLLGLPADSDWVLYAPNRYEPVLIHNPFVHQLSRDMGQYSPRTRFFELYFITHSGPLTQRQYQGIYVLEEKIKIGKHRVNIDRLGAADVQPPQVTGGYLLKIDRLGPGESGFWTDDAALVYVEPKERVLNLPQRAPQRQFLTKYFNQFESALHGPNWKDPVLGYRAYVDVDAWIDYHVLEVLSGNVDSMVYSTYLYKPRNGKLVFGPHWDFDRALGSTDGRDDDPRHWHTGRFFEGPWWRQLFRDPDFWQRWVDRWQELREKQFSREHLNALIDGLAGQLREAQPREAERWDLQPRGASYQDEIDLMKVWLWNRIDFIDEQLAAKPGFAAPAGLVQPGYAVVLTVPPNATVYYTLDGSDPRLPQGGVSSSARIYGGPISLHADAHLVARTRDPAKRQSGGPPSSTPWSGPIAATFKVVAPGPPVGKARLAE
jgi:hypothetical protein